MLICLHEVLINLLSLSIQLFKAIVHVLEVFNVLPLIIPKRVHNVHPARELKEDADSDKKDGCFYHVV